MGKFSQEEYRALQRRDLCTFIHRTFLELNPQATFINNWHLEFLAAKLDACRRGEITRLIINIPPRSLKSICTSVALPAWWLGHAPAAQIICVSYAQDIADKHARDCRAVMSTAWYQDIFPTRLSVHRQAVAEFLTNEQGSRLATSVGGVLTGRGADVIIIDDPVKPEEALSDVQRNGANEWFSHTLYSRLNDKRTGCIIIVMQRLHEDDLVGHVLNLEEWEIVSLPAIAETDEHYVIESSFDSYEYHRKIDEPLHAERESLVALANIKKQLGEYHFAAQYQQSPAPRGGGMVKTEWFKSYTASELPDNSTA